MGSGDGVGKGLTYKGGGHFELPDGSTVKGKKRAEGRLKAIRLRHALQSAATARADIMRRAGIGYGGERDIYTTAGYTPQGKETFDLYWSLYQRDGIAARIVDMAPKTTWKKPPLIVEEGADPDDPTEFMEQFKNLADRLRLWNRFERADVLSRIGQWGVILIGVPGDDSELTKEMPTLNGPDDVLYLTAFHEKDSKITKWVADPSNPRFGLPEEYELTFTTEGSSISTKESRVHWSRVLHIAEDTLTDDVHGRPVLKRVLNPLYDLLKETASTGEAFWQLATRVLVGSVDKDSKMSDEDFTELGENLEEVIHDLRRQFLGQGIDLQWLESTPPDPSSAVDTTFMVLAASAGIPKRVLVGTETGERASEQDERQWLGSISEREEQHAEPNFVRAFIDRLVDKNGLSAPSAGKYEVLWPTLFEETEAKKAEANKARAEAAKALTPIGGNPMEIIEVDSEGNVRLRPTLQLQEEGVLDDGEEEGAEPPENDDMPGIDTTDDGEADGEA
jgi:hypothetical protein